MELIDLNINDYNIPNVRDILSNSGEAVIERNDTECRASSGRDEIFIENDWRMYIFDPGPGSHGLFVNNQL